MDPHLPFGKDVSFLKKSAQSASERLAELYELAVSLNSGGQYETSLAVTEVVLGLFPNHTGALTARWYSHTLLGNLEETLSAVDELKKRAPDARLNHALVAVAALHRHLPGDPASTVQYLGLLQSVGRFEDCCGAIYCALEKSDDDQLDPAYKGRLRLELARCLFKLGDVRQAQEIAGELVIQEQPQKAAFLLAIQISRASLNPSAALNLCGKALTHWPDEDLKQAKVWMLLQTKDLAGASRAFRDLKHQNLFLSFSLNMAARRFEQAWEDIQALERTNETSALQIKRQTARLMLAEGRNQTAFRYISSQLSEHAGDPVLSGAMMEVLLKLDRGKEAIHFAKDQGSGVVSDQNFQVRYANARFANEEATSAFDLLSKLSGGAAASLRSVQELNSLGAQLGWGTIDGQRAAARIDALISRAKESLPDHAIEVLRLHKAVGVCEWANVLEAAGQLSEIAPRDMTYLAIRALAELETGQSTKAIETCNEIMSRDSGSQQAFSIKAAAWFCQHSDYALNYLAEEIRSGRQRLTQEIAIHFLQVERLAELASLLETQSDRQGADSEEWLKELQKFLRNEDTAWPAVFTSLTKVEPLSEPDLNGLRHGDLAPQNNLLRAAVAEVAWTLQNAPQEKRDDWIETAWRATNFWRVVATRSTLPECDVDLVDNLGLIELRDRLAERQATLLVGTHFGAPNHFVFGPHLKNLLALVENGSTRGASRYSDQTMIAKTGSTAAHMVRQLRKGISVLTAPDFPVAQIWPPDVKSMASGILFDVKCEIVDTVPKISRALDIPIYWAQSVWCDGKIVADVRRMSAAHPEESEREWIARWSQDYLDLLAELMLSGPETRTFYRQCIVILRLSETWE